MAQDNAQAAQEFVPIREVREGIVVLKDGSLRAILMASSMNFALKSGDEQQAVLSQFQNFLNSLDFSAQIFIQSRELDIRPYIALVEERYEQQTNDLLKVQTREYIEFIKNFTKSANVMSKNFFVVVPYTQSGFSSDSEGFFSGILSSVGLGGSKKDEATATAEFEEKRAQLEQRISVVQQGLTRAGVRTALLGSEEVVELFYGLFNPGEQDKPIPADKRPQSGEPKKEG